MANPLRIVQLNLAYDDELTSAETLLARYHTLTGWSRAVTRASAAVHVIQRFSADTRIHADDVTYDFVHDGIAGTPDAWTRHDRVVAAVRSAHPDVVHINGLMFPKMVSALRAELPVRTAVVLQDHSGHVPRRPVWPLKRQSMSRWRRAFTDADACTFTAAALAAPWFEVGLPRDMCLLEIPEASTDLVPAAREAARRGTGISASPSVLWVGRLDANKDPLTALSALELASSRLPDLHCWMIYDKRTLEGAVRQRVDDSPILRAHVTLVGAVAHDEMNSYYSASDIFLSASHHEGSGYALIEAMACGVTPCVTDIPAFGALVDGCGARWPVRDAQSAAAALIELATRPSNLERAMIRRHFDEALSWDVIGHRTVSTYREIASRRRAVNIR